jgi:outer membrane protein TolC
VRIDWATIGVGIALALCAVGCRSSGNRFAAHLPSPPTASSSTEQAPEIAPVAFLEETLPEPLPPPEEDLFLLPPVVQPEEIAAPPGRLSLDEVVDSVRNHFPLIQIAAAGRTIASGETLSASGAFDHKVEAGSVSQPLDFYENYRNEVGIKRDTLWGGQTFAGYRIGRGDFEPWYLERQTNEGGEFKVGFTAPLVRDRWIDANRAELWQAQIEQRRVEPEILAQVILYVRDGSFAYWDWVAAGANLRIAEELLELAKTRNEGLVAQVEALEKAPIDLVDNRRIIVSREAKQIEARRKLEQTAVKLSLFFRTPGGEPLLPGELELPEDFPPLPADESRSDLLTDDTDRALAQRPELAELQLVRQQLSVALDQAQNETRPDIDGGLLVSQDVGAPTSPKRDKSELKLEAMVTLTVPLERRKALGKLRSLRGKLAQVSAKSRFASDKIVADVQMARAALEAAQQRVARANESYELAQQMQQAEQELFDLGQSTLFNLNIREQQAAEAAAIRVDTLLEYQLARASYAAAMGYDQPVY